MNFGKIIIAILIKYIFQKWYKLTYRPVARMGRGLPPPPQIFINYRQRVRHKPSPTFKLHLLRGIWLLFSWFKKIETFDTSKSIGWGQYFVPVQKGVPVSVRLFGGWSCSSLTMALLNQSSNTRRAQITQSSNVWTLSTTSSWFIVFHKSS